MIMIDRIAMSIHDSLVELTGREGASWATMTEDGKVPYLFAARRVLGVLRGPTHQMLADGNMRGAPADAGNVWERMIFRALYEQDG